MKSSYRGFFMLEVLLATLLLGIIITIFLKCMHLTLFLQQKNIARINVAENQRIVFQTVRQQLAFYSKQARILPGVDGDRLAIIDVAENRQIAYYLHKDAQKQVIYQEIQVQENQPGINQLTDPYNVEVLEFKVEKISADKLRLTVVMQDREKKARETRSEYLPLLNGVVL